MTEILDKLEAALQEVEEQLLAEFNRIRKTLSAEPFSTIDPGIRNALDQVVRELWHELEHSGDRDNLSLRTERHDDLAARMIVLKKLLDARIPTAYLSEVEAEMQRSRTAVSGVSGRTTRTRKAEITVRDERDDKGILGSIRGMFGGRDREEESSSGGTRTRITDRETPDSKRPEVYLETGIYAANQHLARLASRFQTVGDDREMMKAAITGKAVFESRDLSTKIPDVDIPDDDTIGKASSPEEIRRKLEQRGKRASGTSSFKARDLSTTIPPTRGEIAKTPEAIRKKLEKTAPRSTGTSTFKARDLSSSIPPVNAAAVKPVKARPPVDSTPAGKKVAQTPEEIRRKLEARKSTTPAGKATFGARDIEPVVPRQQKQDKPADREKPAKPTGKAVFEARDLSSGPPEKK